MNYKKNFKNYMYFEITTSIYPGNTSSGYLVSCLIKIIKEWNWNCDQLFCLKMWGVCVKKWGQNKTQNIIKSVKMIKNENLSNFNTSRGHRVLQYFTITDVYNSIFKSIDKFVSLKLILTQGGDHIWPLCINMSNFYTDGVYTPGYDPISPEGRL